MQHQDGAKPSNAYRTILVTPVCPKAMRKRDVWRVDQFHLVKKIGSGYASSVYLGTCHLTGNQVAIKLYHKSKLSELNLFQVGREIRIHGALDHRNIVQMWAAFEDQFGIYLLTEYASKGDVFTEVERRGGQMTEAETVRQVIFPFCSALLYLHNNDIIHRDIKPENLLFTATGVLKVGDFGLSINLNQERPVTRVGTLDYMAPEVVICPDKHRPMDNKEMTHLYYTCLVDAWAVGVLAYELIVGRPPFDKGAKKATIQEILNGEPFLPPWLTEGAGHFIRWSLTKNQRDRPGVQQLMEHPWVQGHMVKSAVGAAHLVQLRAVGRADSFVEMRSNPLLAPDSPVAPSNSGFPGASPSLHAAANPALSAVKASGKPFLQHSNSMNAADTIRFRDLKFDPSPPDPHLGPMPTSAAPAFPMSATVAALYTFPMSPPPPVTANRHAPGPGRPSAGGNVPPPLERRKSNMAGVAAAAAILAAGAGSGGSFTHSSPAHRISSVNSVITESRSRRQSGVGHTIPDPLPPSSPVLHSQLQRAADPHASSFSAAALQQQQQQHAQHHPQQHPHPQQQAPMSPFQMSRSHLANGTPLSRSSSNASQHPPTSPVPHHHPHQRASAERPLEPPPQFATATGAGAVPWPGMDAASSSSGSSPVAVSRQGSEDVGARARATTLPSALRAAALSNGGGSGTSYNSYNSAPKSPRTLDPVNSSRLSLAHAGGGSSGGGGSAGGALERQASAPTSPVPTKSRSIVVAADRSRPSPSPLRNSIQPSDGVGGGLLDAAARSGSSAQLSYYAHHTPLPPPPQHTLHLPPPQQHTSHAATAAPASSTPHRDGPPSFGPSDLSGLSLVPAGDKVRTYRAGDVAPRSPSCAALVPSRLSFSHGSGSFRSMDGRDPGSPPSLVAAAANEIRQHSLSQSQLHLGGGSSGGGMGLVPTGSRVSGTSSGGLPQAPSSPRLHAPRPAPLMDLTRISSSSPNGSANLDDSGGGSGAASVSSRSPRGSPKGLGPVSPPRGLLPLQLLQQQPPAPGSPVLLPPSPQGATPTAMVGSSLGPGGGGGKPGLEDESSLFKKGIFASFKRVFS